MGHIPTVDAWGVVGAALHSRTRCARWSLRCLAPNTRVPYLGGMGESDENEYVPLAELYRGADDDMRVTGYRRDDLDRARSARTTEAVLLAVTPAAAFVADVTVLSIVGGVLGLLATIAITVLATALSLGLARSDQRQLAELGHTARTEPYLALLPVVYLFVRGHRAYRETFEGMGAAWVALTVTILVTYAALVVVPAALALGQMLRQSMEWIAR